MLTPVVEQLNDTTKTADARLQKLEGNIQTFELNTQHDQLKFELSHYNYFVVLVFTAPRDAFTATSYKSSAQNTAEAEITNGVIYKFPTEVLDQLDSYDPATGYVLIHFFLKLIYFWSLYINASHH